MFYKRLKNALIHQMLLKQKFFIFKLQLNLIFINIFDTHHRQNLNDKEIIPQPSIRFTFETNDQLLILAQKRIIELYQQLSQNDEIFENQSLRNNNNSIFEYQFKFHLSFNQHQQPLWQDKIMQQLSAIKNEEQNQIFQKKYQRNHQLQLKQIVIYFRLKFNGIENGVKFCFPSNYQSENNEYLISNDDKIKTQLKKIKFSIDQYIKYLDKNDRQNRKLNQ
ncbi:unnamed protein product [Paramecium sonneborni]|uniref:Uncharacterized protein n=1 Tax=Paramecium sonneborni TaxID=65129 RepID=A0A8S1RS70_9CILI|nr:unnamed protein product [Paramecium sonneborni]